MKNEKWRRRLRLWRKQMHLTQKQLAQLANVSQTEISFLETGKRSFTQETIDKLLKVFKKQYSDPKNKHKTYFTA